MEFRFQIEIVLCLIDVIASFSHLDSLATLTTSVTSFSPLHILSGRGQRTVCIELAFYLLLFAFSTTRVFHCEAERKDVFFKMF